MKMKCCLTIIFFSFLSQFLVDTPLASVCLSCLSPSFASGGTYPGKQRSFELTRVTLMNSEFSFWRSPYEFLSCRSRRGNDYCSVAGRHRCSSAKCSSCLPLLPFSLTRCREQESRPRFLTNEDASM